MIENRPPPIAVAVLARTVLGVMTTSSTPAPQSYVPIDRLAAHLGRPVRVAVLARRSKDDPDTKSLAVQVDVAMRFLQALPEGSWVCDTRDAAVGGDVYRQIVSGWQGNGHHSLLQQILGELARYDAVILYRFDRLARKTLASLQAVEAMRVAGVRLISVTENIDTADPSKTLLTTLMMGIAQQSSDDTSARIRGSKAHAKSVGGWRGGAVIYGLRVAMTLTPDGTVVPVRDAHAYRTLEVDPVQAGHLRWAVGQVVDHGWSMAAVVRDLNARGVPSPRGSRQGPDGQRERIEWSVSGLQRILRNPALCGWDVVGVKDERFRVLEVHGIPHRPHPPVLTDEQWQALQSALTVQVGVRRPHGRALLRGLVRCEARRADGQVCGQSMSGPSDISGATASYSCRASSKHANGDPRQCTGNAVSAKWLELMVITTARLVVDDPAWRAALQRAHQASTAVPASDGEDRAAQLAALDAEMAQLRAEMRGSRSERRRQQVQADLDRLDEQVAALERRQVHARRPGTRDVLLPNSFDELWESIEPTARRALLGDLITRVEVLPRTSGTGPRGKTFDPTRVRIVLHHVGVLHLNVPVDLSTAASPCPECGRRFADALALGSHRRRKHAVVGLSGRPVTTRSCPEPGCKRTSTSAGGILRHRETTHGTPVACPCPVPGCDRVLDRRQDLDSHTAMAHPHVAPDRTPATCTVCGKTLLNHRGLAVHHGRLHREVG